jgi:hypothetical protein
MFTHARPPPFWRVDSRVFCESTLCILRKKHVWQMVFVEGGSFRIGIVWMGYLWVRPHIYFHSVFALALKAFSSSSCTIPIRTIFDISQSSRVEAIFQVYADDDIHLCRTALASITTGFTVPSPSPSSRSSADSMCSVWGPIQLERPSSTIVRVIFVCCRPLVRS